MARPQNQPQTQPQRTPNGPSTKASPMASPTAKVEPMRTMDDATRERIAKRAYEIYMGRGGEQGDEVQDWLQAERELRLGRN